MWALDCVLLPISTIGMRGLGGPPADGVGAERLVAASASVALWGILRLNERPETCW
jgi:hypothetical protein